jgi:hypothetical protein
MLGIRMLAHHDDLRLAAAWWVLGGLPSWELPPIADALLDRGVYSRATAELASTRYPSMSEAGPLFERLLQENEIGLPSIDDAVWTLLRHHISQIALRAVPCRAGLQRVVDVYYLADLFGRARHYVGASHGIEHLLGAFYGYDELEGTTEVSYQGNYGPATVLVWEDTVVLLAHEWLAAHAP